jgi:hypothetical protein
LVERQQRKQLEKHRLINNMALVRFRRIYQLSDNLSQEESWYMNSLQDVGSSSENLSPRNTVALSICHATLRDIICSQIFKFSAKTTLSFRN